MIAVASCSHPYDNSPILGTWKYELPPQTDGGRPWRPSPSGYLLDEIHVVPIDDSGNPTFTEDQEFYYILKFGFVKSLHFDSNGSGMLRTDIKWVLFSWVLDGDELKIYCGRVSSFGISEVTKDRLVLDRMVMGMAGERKIEDGFTRQ